MTTPEILTAELARKYREQFHGYTHYGDGLTLAFWQALRDMEDGRTKCVEVEDEQEIERLRRDCAEAYQVLGWVANDYEDDGKSPTYADFTRALDNLAAAKSGEIRPHDDLLPWPRPPAQNPPSAEACKRCGGSGSVKAMTQHLGPDDYEVDTDCTDCKGTGEITLKRIESKIDVLRSPPEPVAWVDPIVLTIFKNHEVLNTNLYREPTRLSTAALYLAPQPADDAKVAYLRGFEDGCIKKDSEPEIVEVSPEQFIKEVNADADDALLRKCYTEIEEWNFLHGPCADTEELLQEIDAALQRKD